MGYDLHITRADFWPNSAKLAIPFDEWLGYVNSDLEIEPDADNGPEDFLFVGHPRGPVPIWWSRGQIQAKHPDELTIRKLVQIAAKLGARVQGDDGELYDDASRHGRGQS